LEKLIERYNLLKLAQTDDWKARIYYACQNDIIYWINNFCWTKDPRKKTIIPFVCYEFQESFILNLVQRIKEGKDILIEKSRDMGVTWSVLYVFQWFWMFHENFDFLLGSQTQDDVDQSGNPKSLLPRLRLNLEKQPRFLRPPDFDDHFLRHINKTRHSSITGESNKKDFSRQGRYNAILFDEFASWKDTDEEAWTSAGDATPCRIAVSSAKGKNNHFYRLRSGQEGSINVIRLHWKLHPDKTEAWYKEQQKRRSKAEIAQELDIDYAASVTNKAFESWNPSIHIIDNGRFKYTPDLPLELTCDFNIDPMCWSVAQVFTRYSWTFKEYTEHTTLTENVAIKFTKDFKDHKLKECYLFGDPSGKARSTKSLQSDYDIIERILRNAGWAVIRNVAKQQPVMDRINAANKRLSDWEHENEAFEFVDCKCVKLIESIEQTQRKDDGIEKDGMEHHSDGWSYRIAKKYPVRESKAFTIRR
jgi:hypothetical protein